MKENNEIISYKDIRDKVYKNTIEFTVELGKTGTLYYTFDNNDLIEKNIKKYINEYLDVDANIIDNSLQMKFYVNAFDDRFVRVSYDVYDIAGAKQ